jgi:hypothetical protein
VRQAIAASIGFRGFSLSNPGKQRKISERKEWTQTKSYRKTKLCVSEFENQTDEIHPEEIDKISGGGMGPYADTYGS